MLLEAKQKGQGIYQCMTMTTVASTEIAISFMVFILNSYFDYYCFVILYLHLYFLFIFCFMFYLFN